MSNLTVMQGPSGSGKSTIAYLIWSDCLSRGVQAVICSTDDYFIDPKTKKYNYSREKAQEAHKWNQDRVRKYLSLGYDVIVDNTNIRAWEARPYVQMAVALDIPVQFIRCTGRFKNTHGVPDHIIDSMFRRMENLSVEACLNATSPFDPVPLDFQI